MKYQLEISDLAFRYGSKEVLKNINMNIKSGTFITIIGPNGSGKSTLLKNISTYLKPQKGVILLDSEELFKQPRREVSKKISFVPQNTALEFDFKVKDIVMMGRHPNIKKLKGETLDDVRIAERAMLYTNILTLSDRMFNELSGGEKQRVILAQALAQEPKILLLDEPVSHLDLQHQIEILDLIKNMSITESLTVIAVLHDLNMASSYSDYIVMLSKGYIAYEGAPESVLNKKNIAEVFNINVHINGNPLTGKPYLYTLSGIKKPKKEKKIHIICGGGSGQELIRALYSNGFNISTGVLNIGDSDWAVSKECQIDVAEEIPFVEISDDSYKKNKKLIMDADIIVLTPVYYSDANIKNLTILLETGLENKNLYILSGNNFDERDFTMGMALNIYEKVKERKNVREITQIELIDMLTLSGV
ncbi:MAG: ABC transporter ATP-binding protein [Clostridiales bacterium]|nr:ABC transporter ATP-binding protein [Clostridiales bacterium]